MVKALRVNREIRAREVRLVGEKGEQLGIMPLVEAREVAKNAHLDLLEVAPTAVPPVCRLLDYGKYKYEQAKKERETRKSHRVAVVREVRLRPKIGNHDFEAKSRSARKLLNGGDKVRVVVLFRGREITHPELGRRLLQRMVDSLKDVASLDGQPMMDGRRLQMILSSQVGQKTKKSEPKVEES